MRVISLVAIVLCWLMLMTAVTAFPTPFKCFSCDTLESEFQNLQGEQRSSIIKIKRNIEIYQKVLKKLNKQREQNPSDVYASSEKEYYLDVLDTEQGILDSIKNRINRGERVNWDTIIQFTNLKRYKDTKRS